MGQHIINLLFCTMTLSGCDVSSQELQSQRIYFFENEKRAIIIPVSFNDTVKGRFLFDTGIPNGSVFLDSTFCVTNPLPAWSGSPDRVFFLTHTAWDVSTGIKHRQAIYNKPTTVTISDATLVYNVLCSRNQEYSSTEQIQGTIGFPANDSTHVWELNFEQNYMEIHDAANFQRPTKCYWLPFVKKEDGFQASIHIQFPLTIKTVTGDTVTINYPYLIDTGMAQDFALFPSAKEFAFFSKRDDATLITRDGDGYQSRYDVHATAFGDFEIDSMRIYTDEFTNYLSNKEQGLIGLNFLKRFNVFFDFSTQQVGLQPIKDFSRIISPLSRRFYFSINTTSDGRQFVKMIPEKVKNNYYKEAGLKKGDEIIAINGFPIKSLSPENAAKIRNSYTKEMDIIRDGKPIKITVRIDENETKED